GPPPPLLRRRTRYAALMLLSLAGEGGRLPRMRGRWRARRAGGGESDAAVLTCGGGHAGRRLARAANRASIASQIGTARSVPSRRAISWMPVGEVTLISVM